jgi:GMC oxidoreductase
VDTPELGRSHAPIKSRRPVVCIRSAAHPYTNDTLWAGTQFTSQLAEHCPGVLRLGDLDPHTAPDIRVHLAADPEDERRLIEGVRLLCDLASTEALGRLHTDAVTLDGRSVPAADAFAALRAKVPAAECVARTVRHYVHPVRTARMGLPAMPMPSPTSAAACMASKGCVSPTPPSCRTSAG